MKDSIVITGVGKGFGAELFKYFIQKYYVIGLTRSDKDVEALKDSFSLYSKNFDLFAVDVTDRANVSTILNPFINNNFLNIFGLINNAGIRSRKSIIDLDILDFEHVASVNLFAPIYLTKLLLPSMKSLKRGRIINISSILSVSSLPELSAYSVSKAGLDGFTRSLTAEYAHLGITCNSILPGFCETSYFPNFKNKSDLYNMTLLRTPAQRWGSNSELIGLCDLLLGDTGGYINGASIPVDGGWTAC
jgi:NAD(P)-dependent dehydrogenase (short-subunit alcohol dehydrogenase family)